MKVHHAFSNPLPLLPVLSAGACTSDAHGGDHPTLVVEVAHDDLEALVLSANQVPQPGLHP